MFKHKNEHKKKPHAKKKHHPNANELFYAGSRINYFKKFKRYIGCKRNKSKSN